MWRGWESACAGVSTPRRYNGGRCTILQILTIMHRELHNAPVEKQAGTLPLVQQGHHALGGTHHYLFVKMIIKQVQNIVQMHYLNKQSFLLQTFLYFLLN